MGFLGDFDLEKAERSKTPPRVRTSSPLLGGRQSSAIAAQFFGAFLDFGDAGGFEAVAGKGFDGEAGHDRGQEHRLLELDEGRARAQPAR